MHDGCLPGASPGGAAGRYDACNLFLLPPIFFPPLDQLLLIPGHQGGGTGGTGVEEHPERGIPDNLPLVLRSGRTAGRLWRGKKKRERRFAAREERVLAQILP